MINAPHDKEFIFHDGTRARNLLDLVAKLEGISDHEFHTFVNHHKNDFANWTEHVLLDKHFAERLRTIDSRIDTIQLLKDKINDVTIGSSIIHIPRLEDHRTHHIFEKHFESAAEKNSEKASENVSEKNIGDEKYTIERHPIVDMHVPSETHDEAKKNLENERTEKYPANETNTLKEYHEEKKEKHHEKSEQQKAGHNWFKLFSTKNLSENKIEKIEIAQEDKLNIEKSLKDGVAQNDRENALWIILYFALVLLIITLLVYKLFLS